MKKVFAVVIAGALALTALAGCGDGEKGGNENNEAPVISGVKASATVMVGEEFDALAGVTAYDEEDGDITSEITVESSGLTFTNGKTTPTTPSEFIGYEIIYSVTDSDGETAQEYCTLYVTPAAEGYFSFDFSDVEGKMHGDAGEGDSHWWTPEINEENATATTSFKKGAFVFDVEHNGSTDTDIALQRGFENLGAGRYSFVVWAYSSVETKVNMHALLSGASNWEEENLGGGAYHKDVGTSLTKLEHEFELTKDDASVLFRISLGGKEEGLERPDAFSFAIEKIAIYKTTGAANDTELYAEDFSTDASSVVTDAGDGAAANVVHENEAAKVNISSYPTSGGGIWSLKVEISLGNVEIKEGVKYRYSVDFTSTNDQAGEFLIESKAQYDRERANFSNFSLSAGKTETVVKELVAEKDVADPVIRLQIGNPADGVTSNVITIDNVKLERVEGNLETSRVAQDKFALLGNGSSNAANKKQPLDMFNGSDDNPNNAGTGTVYIEDGKLIYVIHEGSTEAGQNKLAFGFWDNPLELPEDVYYTVRIKIKASVPVSFNLCLHDMEGNWEDGVGGGVLLRKADWQNPPAAISIGPEETVVTFKTDVPAAKAYKCELLLEFGSLALSKLQDVRIEISELSILINE